MLTLSEAIALASGVTHELTLFAVAGFLIGGLSDLAIDVIWLGRTLWRHLFIYRRFARATASTLPPAEKPGLVVIFIPTWDEGAVIAPMLRHAVVTLKGGDWRIYVGAYPNDASTIAAVSAFVGPHLRLVVGPRNGPTTKADCLNAIWRQLNDDEAREGRRAKAVVLHDAEDVMHSSEIHIYDRLIERFALVQLPVLPLIDRRSRWIGGHYNDEFAESHGKSIVVREAIGAAIPSAGVGCAFDRTMLGRIADQRDGAPFDQDSLTEDYELGLRISELGGRGAFVRLPSAEGRAVVAVRAHFPATLEAAVRQKARWMVGIALSGWDRLGWRGGFAESWMRLHDRRALLAALALLAAYAALVLSAIIGIVGWLVHQPLEPLTATLEMMLIVTGALLVWRLLMRFAFVTRAYGWREGLRSLPRAIVANVIAMMAARRAIGIYLRMRRDGVVRWDKTVHEFPASMPAE